MRIVLPGEFYRHFKNKLYQVKGIAYHSETGEKMVVYQAMYGDFKWYVRPYDMFTEEVDHDKYPEVKQKYRFERVETDTVSDAGENAAPDTGESETDGQSCEECESETNGQSCEECESAVNPALIAFLDAESYRDKLNVLVSIRSRLDDRLVNDIATSMDITVPDGPIDERYMSLKSCVMAHAKYEESNRLRS